MSAPLRSRPLLAALLAAAGLAPDLAPGPHAQCERRPLLSLNPSPGAFLGWDMVLRGDQLLVSAPLERLNGVGNGAVYLFRRTEEGWVQERRFRPPNTQQLRLYGECIAMTDDRVLIGATGDGGLFQFIGALYVYEGPGFTQATKLVPSDGAPVDNFGCVAASELEDLIAVGSPGDDDGGFDSGSFYVFEKLAGVWTETAKIAAPDGEEGDFFGFPMEIAGGQVLVGARGSNFAAPDGGAVHVYERIAGEWVELQRLGPPGSIPGAGFGRAIAVDGERMLVGANGGKTDQGPGAGYLYQRGADGLWHLEAELLPSGPSWVGLGSEVALQGERALLVGGWRSGAGLSSRISGALVFELEDGVWREVKELVGAGQNSGAFFCAALDGDDVLVGDPGLAFEDRFGAGGVTRFSRELSNCTLSSFPANFSVRGPSRTQELAFHPGEEFAGQLYVILGSGRGVWPGFTVQGRRIPLNADDYFVSSLAGFNRGWFDGNVGILDENGEAVARVTLGPHPFAFLRGNDADHVGLVFDVVTGALLHVSNWAPMDLTQ